GANYGLQSVETGPTTYPTYGITVSVGLVPEPSTKALLVGGLSILTLILRRRG
ncbi:PEP-CTERM sorting domain-containing protein, partial [bacterium]|nr:PEP-CTERM sorting domain-containing protein [bacterium]